MKPAKSERSSRRSSILKTPKPRQPLQNVEPVESSAENSPASTKKLKRRVSFAEKKHVKEFCDSVEQGTVWDNTYEESELSQRNSQNSNSDENIIAADFVVDEVFVRESIVTSLELRHSSTVNLENNRVVEETNWSARTSSSVIQGVVVETVHAEATRIPFPVNHLESLKTRRSLSLNDGHKYFAGPNEVEKMLAPRVRTNSCSAAIHFDAPKSQERESLTNMELSAVAGENCNDVVPMDETIIETTPVELTAPILMSRDVAIDRSPFPIPSDTPSINTGSFPNELLLPSVPSIENSKSNEESLTKATESAEQARFTVFHDNSSEMEIESEVEPAFATEKPMFQEKTRETLETFEDRRKSDLQSERSILNDKSMELTEAVPMTRSIERARHSPTSKTTIFHNESIECTEVVHNVPCIGKLQEPPPERTTIVHNKSMDVTESVLAGVISSKKWIFDNPESARGTIFGDESIHSNEIDKSTDKSQVVEFRDEAETEGRKVPQNIKSFELAEAISRISSASKSVSQSSIRSIDETIGNDPKPHATASQEPLFKDTDSEIQSPLPKRLKSLGNNPIDVIAAQPHPTLANLEMQRSIKLSDDEATVMPEVTPKLSTLEAALALQFKTHETTNRRFSEKTSIFHDQSMEETNVVGSFPCVSHPGRTVAAATQEIKKTHETTNRRFSEKTSIFHDQSMEETNVVGSFPCVSHPGRIVAPATQEIKKTHETTNRRFSEKTSIFHDQSMEETNVVGSLPCVSHPGRSVAPSAQEITKTHETTNRRFSEKTNIFHDQSMEETNIVGSFPCVSHPDRTVAPSAKEITNTQNTSAEPMSALPESRSFKPISEDYADFNPGNDSLRVQDSTLLKDESMEMTCAIPGIVHQAQKIFEENPINPMIHDQSMEMTVPVSTLSLARKNAIQERNYIPDCGETKTTIFSDVSMDLTKAVHYPKHGNRENHSNQSKCEKSESNMIKKFGNEEKTVVFHDDGMELTRAVDLAWKLREPFLDKENCPVGLDNNSRRRPCRAQIFEARDSNVAMPKYDSLRTTKPDEFSSRQENKENITIPSNPDERRDTMNFGSDDITGVMPFLTEIEEAHVDERENEIYEADRRRLDLENQEMEITGVAPWSWNPVNVSSRSYSSDSPRLDGAPREIESLPPAETIQRRSGQVAKELFQKPISNPAIPIGDEIEQKNANERTRTEDLDAMIQKLAESFAMEDVSGFDQATFLRQQARCMEDYEANSTASQECNSATLSAKMDVAPKRVTEEFCVSPKFNDTANPVANEETLITDDWEVSSRSRKADAYNNASVHNKDGSLAEDHRYASKSLEELRCRVDTVNRFRLESTIMLEDLQAIEPPSIVLEESITMGQPEFVHSATSGYELSSKHGVFGKDMVDEVFPETDDTSAQPIEDVPNVSFDIAQITMTQTVRIENIANDKENECPEERMEKSKNRRSESVVVKPPISDVMALMTASSDVDHETTKTCRSSSAGLTTADEFTSESPDGPSEKLRRRESFREIEGKDEELTKSMSPWESKDFACSTGVYDTFARRSMHRGNEEPAVVLESSLSDELPSAVDTNDDQNVHQSIHMEETADDIGTEAEVFVPKNPFGILKETIENLAPRFETIWTLNRLDEKIVAFNFFSDSIVLALYFNEGENASAQPIQVIDFLSQLVEEGTDPGVSLAHSLIMKKIDSASLTRAYRTFEQIPELLDYVSTEVKAGMDFMFELDRLRNRNVMEVNGNRVTFLVRTRDINAGIILNITMEIRSFEDINCNDIAVSYILGKEKVRENDIKRLITNVKRDHRFLRYYMSDVNDYVDLMAETGFSTRSETGAIAAHSIC